jgi:hypothetical protein
MQGVQRPARAKSRARRYVLVPLQHHHVRWPHVPFPLEAHVVALLLFGTAFGYLEAAVPS